ncbi:hypothetical protein [uncultured Kordia sp.]|uniref:hypothetical protein n=1 Tax=uncultured Kordia sp. TaxID=507699 RepID=UPI00262A149A|nr:hypothetical protein [uncultured Kordia sp.]
MKKQHLKLLKLNKNSISNFSIYGGAPPPRDTEDTLCGLPIEKEEEEHPNTTSTYALSHLLEICY